MCHHKHFHVAVLFVLPLILRIHAQFGPPYPVTGAWFQDRFSAAEWNVALSEFSKQGGDTALLRAPSIRLSTIEDLNMNPDFQWCGNDTKSCFDEAVEELTKLGLHVTQFATYQYEEDFNPISIMRCSNYDKKIISSRIYYRLVLPLDEDGQSAPCNLTGARVMVLFTSYAGIDPHALLLQTAQKYNISVFFGLPYPQMRYNSNGWQMEFKAPYVALLQRILADHQFRYQTKPTEDLYSVLKGYYFSNELLLTELPKNGSDGSSMISFLSLIGDHIREFDKKFAFSAFVQSNRLHKNSSMNEYLSAFEALIRSGAVDIISIKDGRGTGNGALFWPTQGMERIVVDDHELFQILTNQNPSLGNNVTYNDIFWTSISEMFSSLAFRRDNLTNANFSIDLWLDLEAYNLLYDDPCVPIDRFGSGMDRMHQSIRKSRLDRVLSHAGASVQKVVSMAWDPCYTCKTKNITTPLHIQIINDVDRPIISSCFLHSSFNRSVVVIGYNLMAETQQFTVNWPNVNGHRITSVVHGYYFELDWGIRHGRVQSLMYSQLYDPYDSTQLAPKGYISVIADGSFHACTFKYDFTKERTHGTVTETINKKDKEGKVLIVKKLPVYRIYGW